MLRNKYEKWSEENIKIFGGWFPTANLSAMAKMFDLDTEKSVSGMASYFRSLGYEIGFRG
jgi:hypothetical protein